MSKFFCIITLFTLINFNISVLNPQELNKNSPYEVMNTLLTLFKSYHKAPKDGKLTIEKKEENKKTALKIDKIFHYESLIQGALKDQWNSMSKKQQQEFFDKFKKLIELVAFPQGSYFYNNSKNTIKKPVINGNKAVIASQNYNFDKDIEVSMSYVFQEIGGNWLLIDAELNEHSLVDAYRLQINRVVEKSGLEGLMEALNKKYDEEIAKIQ